jgi:23S rRNA pseudouridine955/2504/2580 synthase
MSSPITLPVRETDGEVRLDRFLRRKFTTLTQGRIEQMIRKGQIRIDGVRAKKAGDRLSPGAEVTAPRKSLSQRRRTTGLSACG